MFDKIKITATVSHDECVHLAEKHRLQMLVSANGEIVGYGSGEYAKIRGVIVGIKFKKSQKTGKTTRMLAIATSLHKYWQLANFGKL